MTERRTQPQRTSHISPAVGRVYRHIPDMLAETDVMPDVEGGKS